MRVTGQRNLLVPGGEVLNRAPDSALLPFHSCSHSLSSFEKEGQPSFGREINLPVHPLPG